MEFARLMVESASYLPKVIEDVIKDLTEDDSFYGAVHRWSAPQKCIQL